jgi:arginase
MRIEVVEMPSGLGLRARGVEHAAAALADAGLANRLGARRVHTVPSPAPDPTRDTETGMLNPAGIVTVSTRLADAIEQVLDDDGFPVVIGGDCSVLLSSMLALRRRGRYGLLHVDGHADFWHPSQEPAGEAASLDLALVTGRGPTGVTNLEGLAPLVRDDDVAQLGYRSTVNDSYLDEHIRDTAIGVHDLGDVRRLGIETCTARAIDTAARPELDGMWLHLDVDVLDDDLMPAVDYRSPGGLSWEEVGHVVAASADSGRLVGLQVTIYNPALDAPGAPLATRIVDLLASGLRAHAVS